MVTLLTVMAVTLLMGVPVAFSIAISGVFYLLVESSVPVLVFAQRMVVGVESFTLLAIPLFLLAGALMAEGGITPRIMRLASACVGHIPGGLAVVMVLSCMLFGAISGSGVADVAAIGSIMLPAMKSQGYRPAFCAALLGCAGSLGTIIPPSIVMVVLGVSMGVSIGKLFLGGILPGILAGGALMGISYLFSVRENYPRLKRASGREILEALRGALLPLFTPGIIIGGIVQGIFTATEAGAVAVLYAFILSVFVYRKVTLQRFFALSCEVGRTSAVVLFIIAAASLFGWILTAEDIPQKVATVLLSLSREPWALLIFFNLLLILLGMFMETIAIILIMVPIFYPIMQQVGVDPIHFGVMVCVNLAVGANTPPLGVDLLAACKIAGIPYEDSFRYILPFVGAMIVALALIVAFPLLVTGIPNWFMR